MQFRNLLLLKINDILATGDFDLAYAYDKTPINQYSVGFHNGLLAGLAEALGLWDRLQDEEAKNRGPETH